MSKQIEINKKLVKLSLTAKTILNLMTKTDLAIELSITRVTLNIRLSKNNWKAEEGFILEKILKDQRVEINSLII